MVLVEVSAALSKSRVGIRRLVELGSQLRRGDGRVMRICVIDVSRQLTVACVSERTILCTIPINYGVS